MMLKRRVSLPRREIPLDEFDLTDGPPMRGFVEVDNGSRWFELALEAQVQEATTCSAGPLDVLENVERGADNRALGEYLRNLFSLARREPYNATLYDEISCLLRSINARGTSKRGSPTVRKRSPNYIIYRSMHSLAVPGIFRNEYAPLLFPADEPPAFVLKTSAALRIGMERIRAADFKNYSPLLNEAVVGVYALNPLRRFIPTFMHVYGAYYAPSSTVSVVDEEGRTRVNMFETSEASTDDRARLEARVDAMGGKVPPPKQQREIFTAKGYSWYNMVETIAGAPTLREWLSQDQRKPREVHEVLSQVFLALKVAAHHLGGFSHGNLTIDSVLVSTLRERVTLAFPVSPGETAYLETGLIARIVDFEASRARIAIKATRRIKLDVEDFHIARQYPDDPARLYLYTGISERVERDTFGSPNYEPDALGDVITLLRSVEAYVDDLTIAGWLRTLLGGDSLDLERMRAWERSLVPQGVTIDVGDYVRRAHDAMKRYGGSPPKLAFVDSADFPDNFAPLLSCSENVCTHVRGMKKNTNPAISLDRTLASSKMVEAFARAPRDSARVAVGRDADLEQFVDIIRRTRAIYDVVERARLDKANSLFASFINISPTKELARESAEVLDAFANLSENLHSSEKRRRAIVSEVREMYRDALEKFIKV